MLWAMVGVALLSLCMSSAWRGNRPALGLSVAIIGSFIPIAIYAAVHWFAFAVALLPFPGKPVALSARESAPRLPDEGSFYAETDSPRSQTSYPDRPPEESDVAEIQSENKMDVELKLPEYDLERERTDE